MDHAAIVLLCRLAANSAEHAALAEQMLEDVYLKPIERQRWQKCLDDHRWTGRIMPEIVTDAALLAAYQDATGLRQVEHMNILAGEIKRRGLIYSDLR